MRPRLLILITLAEAGGAQTAVSLLLPGLAKEFDVTLAGHGSGPLRDTARASGVPFVEVEHLRRELNPWHDGLAVFELVRLCRRLRPDIVHAHSSKAGALGRLAAAIAGVPIRIFTVHGWAFDAYKGLVGRLYLWIERALARLTTCFVCVCNSARDLGVAAGACQPERTVVINNAVDASSFVGNGRRNGRPQIVSVGRFAFPKDFATLVQALSETGADYPASFAGEGPLLTEVAAEVQRLGLDGRVEFLGTREDVPRVLASADIFVLSSRSEGLPISILEAMAAGLPVIASDVGGVSEAVVDGETGLLVPAADVDALAEALERLLSNAQLRRRLGARGRERARDRFDLGCYRRAHVELYQRELELHAQAAAGDAGSPALARLLTVAAAYGE